MKIIPFTVLACLLYLNCNSSKKAADEATNLVTQSLNTKNSAVLIGKWKHTASYISAGGPQYWVDASGEDYITFAQGGNYYTTIYPNCKEASYRIAEDKFSVSYTCPEAQHLSEIKYGYKIEKDSLLLTGYNCREGCSYKYVKVK